MVAIYVDLLGPHPISPFILSKFVEELEKTVWAQIVNMLSFNVHTGGRCHLWQIEEQNVMVVIKACTKFDIKANCAHCK
jgi:hypothetical protein